MFVLTGGAADDALFCLFFMFGRGGETRVSVCCGFCDAFTADGRTGGGNVVGPVCSGLAYGVLTLALYDVVLTFLSVKYRRSICGPSGKGSSRGAPGSFSFSAASSVRMGMGCSIPRNCGMLFRVCLRSPFAVSGSNRVVGHASLRPIVEHVASNGNTCDNGRVVGSSRKSRTCVCASCVKIPALFGAIVTKSTVATSVG